MSRASSAVSAMPPVNEDNPIVMRHLLRAMTFVNTPEAHKALLTAVKSVVTKIGEHPEADSPLLNPYLRHDR